ncbi:MAG: hypothetical protein KAS67_04075, partial [Thermoplasmata archaeon]|nr:hypothetical protein [Thermoplasmata archaeon]
MDDYCSVDYATGEVTMTDGWPLWAGLNIQAWLNYSISSTSIHSVIVNCTTLEPGFYQANITVSSNDPDEAEITIPVNLTVTPTNHDIKVSDITAPSLMYLGDTVAVNATATNLGLSDETNIEVQLREDGVPIDWSFINLSSGNSQMVNFDYSPISEGIFNISIYAVPVPGENITFNNENWTFIEVIAVSDIWVTPNLYNFTVTAGEIHQDNMAIGNDGFGDLYFNITDDAGGIATNPVLNPSFETGDFTDWVAQDMAGPLDPLQVVMSGYFGWFFPVAPTNGSFAVNHGFDGDGPGTIQVAQDLAIPPGATALEFDYRAGWEMSPYGGTLDRIFRVDIEPAGGGIPLQSDIILVAVAGTDVWDTGDLHGIVDLSAFGGSTVRISFEWDIPESFTGPGQFQFDNVTLYGGGADCDWLSEFPTSGIVPPSNDTNIEITVDATTLNPGFYQANITISSNDPDENPVIVPVYLTVLPPDHDIKVYDIIAPTQMYLGDTTMINATVMNQGLSNEADIEIQLREDGIVIDWMFISLNSGNSQVVSFDYTPVSAGIFNISIYAVPVPGENITFNNEVWTYVEVIAVPDIWVTPNMYNLTVTAGDILQENMTIGNDGFADL